MGVGMSRWRRIIDPSFLTLDCKRRSSKWMMYVFSEGEGNERANGGAIEEKEVRRTDLTK